MDRKNLFWFNPLIILFLIISTILLLIYSLGNSEANEVVKYFTYLYSSFSLIVVLFNVKSFCLFIKSKVVNGGLYKRVREFLFRNKYIERYFTDKKFSNHVALYLSVVINFIFIFKKLYEGVTFKSVWFISFAIYYIFLVMIKFFLLRKYNSFSDLKEEYRVYRSVGYFMMALNLVLAIMIVQMVVDNVATIYPGNVIYLSALYSFYLIISAIVGFIQYRKYNSPILSSVKAINLFTAFVSILMLQTTMIATFSNDSGDFMRLMNMITGSFVIIIILVISTYMVIRGSKEIKQ